MIILAITSIHRWNTRPGEDQKMEDSSGNSNSSQSTLVPDDQSVKNLTPVVTKEKITSNINAMADTGSQWSDLTSNEGTSLATTIASKATTSAQSTTPLRAAIEKGLEVRKEKKIDLERPTVIKKRDDDVKSVRSLRESLKSRAQSRAELESLPDDTEVPSEHAQELLNEAVLMDRTLDEIQGLELKRPKNLMLGKKLMCL